ncbi:diaminopimelate decarboxylase family protein [Specibacter cremeus]|uniref:diaminopimelate decarboxylase family protein n=1 Tax=Specibacter cremeus TaxID=1629051 RepID=UPI001F0BBCE0|nr:diaminopimelate decarboxylase [Specibacter cremeus]
MDGAELAPAWLPVPGDLNALTPAMWARDVARNDDGGLAVGGTGVESLKEQFGTPLFVLSETDFRARARLFKESFDEAFAQLCGGVDVYYAGKSFLCTEVARWVESEGLRLDTCSGGELAVAARAGLPGEKLGLHGNNKSDAEIGRALDMRLGRIVVDSLHELARVAAIAARRGEVARVMLRLTPGVHAHTHEFIATAHEDQKFGLSMVSTTGDRACRDQVSTGSTTGDRACRDQVSTGSTTGDRACRDQVSTSSTTGDRACRDQVSTGSTTGVSTGSTTEMSAAEAAVVAAKDADSIELLGFHAHIGSQIFEPDGFEMAARRLLTFTDAMQRKYGITLPELDLGGGYGIAYTAADTPRPTADIAKAMAAVVRETCDELGLACPRISIEPGRAIAGPSTFTLYETGTLKTVQVDVPGGDGRTAPRRYVSVDGGMSDNARPVLYDADYSAVLANRSSDAPPVLSRVVGKHCESGDIVVRDVYLPSDVAAGDLLAVPGTGAYCWALASNYNYVPRPPVVAVKDGAARLIVRGETEDDLLARDLGA